MSDITAARPTSANEPTLAALKAGLEGLNEDGQPEVFLEGADWESVTDAITDETLIINMGPQHPSTHGVLRLVLELDGETVTNLTPIIGYLHTGIEKSAEHRSKEALDFSAETLPQLTARSMTVHTSSRCIEIGKIPAYRDAGKQPECEL